MNRFLQTCLPILALAALIAGCAAPGNSVYNRELDYSIIKTFKIEAPKGLDMIAESPMTPEFVNAAVVSALTAELESKGMKRVDESAGPDITISPRWIIGSDTDMSQFRRPDGRIEPALQRQITLEVSFVTTNGVTLWRGWASWPANLRTLSELSIEKQARWALADYPPKSAPAKAEKAAGEKVEAKSEKAKEPEELTP